MSKYSPDRYSGNPEIRRGLPKGWVQGVNEEEKLRLLAAAANEQKKTNELLKKHAAEAAAHNEIVEEHLAEQTELIREHQLQQNEERKRAANWRVLVASIGDAIPEVETLPDSNAKTIAIAVLLHRIENLTRFENTELSLDEILTAKQLVKAAKAIESAHLKAIGESRTTAETSADIIQGVTTNIRHFRDAFVSFTTRAREVYLLISGPINVSGYETACREWSAETDSFQKIHDDAFTYMNEIMELLPSVVQWEAYVAECHLSADSVSHMIGEFDGDSVVVKEREQFMGLIYDRAKEMDALLAEKEKWLNAYLTACNSCDVRNFLSIRRVLGNFRLFDDDAEAQTVATRMNDLVEALRDNQRHWNEYRNEVQKTKSPRFLISSRIRIGVTKQVESIRESLNEASRIVSQFESKELADQISIQISDILTQVEATAKAWTILCSNLKKQVIFADLILVSVIYYVYAFFLLGEGSATLGEKALGSVLGVAALVGLWFTNIKWISRAKPLDREFMNHHKRLSDLQGMLVGIVAEQPSQTGTMLTCPPKLVR